MGKQEEPPYSTRLREPKCARGIKGTKDSERMEEEGLEAMLLKIWNLIPISMRKPHTAPEVASRILVNPETALDRHLP